MSLVFHAATYDNQTFECLDLPVGTGPATYTSDANLYLPDHNGVYVQIGAGNAPWHGARWDGGTPYADNGSGTLLDPLPSLYAAPALTNDIQWSRDLSNAWWTNSGVVATYDQAGITGEPNTATLIDKPTGGVVGVCHKIPTLAGTAGTVYTAKFIVKKDANNTRVIGLRLWRGASDDALYQFNTSTGQIGLSADVTPTQPVSSDVVDGGDWWHVYISITQESNGNTNVQIRPADAASVGAPNDDTVTGSFIMGQAELHVGKTIAQVKGAGPIFTDGAAVTVGAATNKWPNANHDQTQGAYFAECRLFDTGNRMSVLSLREGVSEQSVLWQNSPTIGRSSGAGGTAQIGVTQVLGQFTKWGAVYDANSNQLTVSVDGGYGSEVGYTSYTVQGSNLVNGEPVSYVRPMLTRNIRRYDDSYDDAKTIIDQLMLIEDGGFPEGPPSAGGHRNDSKYAALGGPPGHIDDLEVAWLKQELGQ